MNGASNPRVVVALDELLVAEATTIGSGFLNEANAFSAGITEEIEKLLRHGMEMSLLRNIDAEAVALSTFGALKEAIHRCCFGDGSRQPENIIPRVIRSQANLLLKYQARRAGEPFVLSRKENDPCIWT